MRRIIKFKDVVDILESPTKNGWDNTPLVTGRERSGKSVLCIQLGSAIQKCSYKEYILNNIIYSPTPKAMEEKIKDKRIKVTQADEIVKALLNTEFNSSVARFLTKFFAVCGSENKVNFLILPRKEWLVKAFRNGRCYYWIHCAFRGVAVLFQYIDFGLATDGWMTKENDKIIRKIFRKGKNISDLTPEQELELYSQSPNYVGEFYYDPLPEEDEKIYIELKEKYKYENLTLSNEETYGSKREKEYYNSLKKLFYYLYRKKMLSQTKIADLLGWKVQRVNDFIRKYEKENNL